LRDQPDDTFYLEAHRHVYAAILSLFQSNTPIDPVTLMEKASHDGTLEKIGGASYIAELSGAVPTSANIEYYAKIVLEAALRRRLITSCTKVVSLAYGAADENDTILDIEQLVDRAEADIFSIAERRQLNPIYAISDLIDEGVVRIEEQLKSHTGITGLATGYTKLDEMLSGLQPSDMVILAARPSVGKTAFSLNIAAHVATQLDKGALVFSLEMSKEQLTQRLLCMVGLVDSSRLRTGFLARNEFPKVQRAAEILKSSNKIFIDDTPNINVLELRSKARRHAAQKPVDVIIIDYLQLMSSPSRRENRQVEISEISRAVKGIARELRVPVLALSQLSREAEKDDTGTPKLSHLRESGAIEQDADVVLMLSRPPVHDQESHHGNLIRVNIAKQRNGPTGMLELLFEKNIQRFRNVMDGPSGEAAPASSYAKAPAAAPPTEAFDAYDYDDGDEEDAPF
jgi:replicative DNA helicase